MDKERLEELKKLCEDATPGPWTPEYSDYGDEIWFGGRGWGMWSLDPVGVYLSGQAQNNNAEDMAEREADAKLIAASRTALPELIAEVEFLTKVAEQAIMSTELYNYTSVLGCPELAQYLKRGKE
jgi:hypothetical protein